MKAMKATRPLLVQKSTGLARFRCGPRAPGRPVLRMGLSVSSRPPTVESWTSPRYRAAPHDAPQSPRLQRPPPDLPRHCFCSRPYCCPPSVFSCCVTAPTSPARFIVRPPPL
ncbi:hypothetical protein P280DRAFT_73667 [Massarina eburnea CBS 473.64]|uniref:Uncharacterized protein n=1 Tax=Massarina eburnea CBS 473.64 TaxID=1395130 RepID=A0A6A6RTQ1_9PLEO|nr:hypothetical protein P280DRAFT_73667 [Massarina eburnea CBS 473.64]